MEGMIGEIRMFAGNFAPKNWSFCQGQTIAIQTNTALYSILGTTYGGNGQTTFMLPNLASRVAIGAGAGPGLSNYNLGEAGGAENVTLGANSMPAHTHVGVGSYTPQVSTGGGDETNPTGGYMASSSAFGDFYVDQPNVVLGAVNLGGQVGITGGGQPHTNLQPLLAMNYVICLYGIYPTRN